MLYQTMREGDSYFHHQQQPVTNIHSMSYKFLDKAAQLINVCCEADRSYNDLKYKVHLQKIDQPTVSGLNESDYPSYDSLNFGNNTEFAIVKRSALPQELLDQISRMECNFSMGLFPEVNRSWISVDSDLFVWNYESSCDLAYFDGISNTILTLVITKPRPNALAARIQYVMCVVTSVEVVLLGVNFVDAEGNLSDDYRSSEMYLSPEPLFKCSLDGVIIGDACCSRDGRIFLCGRDGCLYEIKYQKNSIFGRYCKKINHSKGVISYLIPSVVAFAFGKDEPLMQLIVDESRSILFTRSEQGSVQVFDLSEGQAAKVASLTSSEIQYTASRVIQTVDQSHFKHIVSISPIPASDSALLNLIGITQSGVRLYFTCYNNESPSTIKPQTLKLVHIRFPPGFCPSSSLIKPERVHKSWTSRETTLMTSAYDEQTDLLWCYSNTNFPFRADYIETQIQIPIRGRTWILSGMTTDIAPLPQSHKDRDSYLNLQPPLISQQHNESSKSFVIMTPQAYFILERLRPVDILMRLLVEYGPDSNNVKTFFQLHQPSQAGAMCLMLASSSTHHERQVSDRALRALFLYGGEAKPFNPGSSSGQQYLDGSYISQSPHYVGSDFHRTSFPIQTSTPAASSLARPSIYRSSVFDAAPSSPNLVGNGHGDVNLSSTTLHDRDAAPKIDVKFSDKHNAFYLYASRLLGSIWQSPVVSERTILHTGKKSIEVLDCAFTDTQLSCTLEQLSAFLAVMKQSANLPPAALQDDINMQSQLIDHLLLPRRGYDDVFSVEQQSLFALYILIRYCQEVLGLLKVLVDHQMHVVLGLLPKEQLEKMRIMTFDRLVVDGKQLCSDLVFCLLNQYLADRATTDSISERLRRVCPSLYTSDDATSAKANELLVTSKTVSDDEDRKNAMNKALNMYKKIADQIDLPTVCAQLEEAHSYEAIVDLCLCAARKIDPSDSAIQTYRKSNIEFEDLNQRQIFTNRLACYKCITEVMNNLLAASTGRHPTVPAQQAKYWLDTMINLAISNTNDELCHVTVFDWLFERNLLRDLIPKISSPYLEDHLVRCISNSTHLTVSATYMDLLWKLYEQQKKFIEAAEVLLKLSGRHGPSVDLAQRITYLSRAVLCCKASNEPSPRQSEFLHDLEDKLEVAKLQMQIVDALRQQCQTNEIRSSLAKLNMDLLDVTQLYTDYAEKYKLSECKLAIIRCADHHDPTLVENLWKEITDKELSNQIGDDVQTRSQLLATKVKALVKQYSNSPRFLPQTFLMKYLFAKSVDNGFEADWLADTLIAAGLSYYDLLSVLDSTFKQWTNTPLKKDRKLQIYVLKALCGLMESFWREKAHFSIKERNRIQSKFLDCLALYVVELETMPSGAESISLQRRFADLQVKFDTI